MNLQAEIERVVRRYIAHVEGAVRKRAREIAPKLVRKASGVRKAARKPKRGARHCRLCEKRGHDARNCDKKAPKRAVLHIAKAA